MSTSVRDLIITGWAIIFVVTLGVIAFHPSFKDEELLVVLRTGGFALISTSAGIGLVRFTEFLGRSTSLTRKIVLGVFVVSMLPLIPVAVVTFGMPWGALILITLVYVRWKWALVSSTK
ncbi:MAG: hypothetical protein HQ477_09780 [Chloroflexi bacterium]|nr:hypothetical protein [Chloroflexota bacterium]